MHSIAVYIALQWRDPVGLVQAYVQYKMRQVSFWIVIFVYHSLFYIVPIYWQDPLKVLFINMQITNIIIL